MWTHPIGIVTKNISEVDICPEPVAQRVAQLVGCVMVSRIICLKLKGLEIILFRSSFTDSFKQYNTVDVS